jgi:precorrin-6Y C5,15-methyltransferase (decarboxylating)
VTPWLTIVGIGEGGVMALPGSAQALIAGSAVVLGPERLLAGLPPSGTLPLVGNAGEGESQKRIAWTSPLSAMLDQVRSLRGTGTVILATGDPMWFGIGATLANHLPPDEFTVIPHPAAFQLAAARLRWPLQHVATLSLHGRAVEAIHPHLLPGNRILALTSDRTTCAAVAQILVARGYGESQLTVLEHLGGAAERITTTTSAAFDATAIGDFHTLAVDCVAGPGAALLPPVSGLPDEAFISDGQLTKREVRAATLARLAPYPGALLWDVGAGCGSVAIEWLRAARDANAIAFERDPARRDMIARNALAFGTPTLAVVPGDAPASLAGQSPPDAIFLGGDVGNRALFDACWSALRPGGRLVANAVTVDGEQELYARHAGLGGELVRIDVSVLDRIGDHRVLRPRMAVTQWAVTKP